MLATLRALDSSLVCSSFFSFFLDGFHRRIILTTTFPTRGSPTWSCSLDSSWTTTSPSPRKTVRNFLFVCLLAYRYVPSNLELHHAQLCYSRQLHPSNYSLAPMLLDFSDRTGSGIITWLSLAYYAIS